MSWSTINEPLATAISDRLAIPSWEAAIQETKSVVANAIRSVDPTVSIEDTGHFNHSFAPDLRLAWGGKKGARRDVFLRLNPAPQFIESDFETIGDRSPVLLGLHPDYGSLEEVGDGVGGRAAESDVLIAVPQTVEQLLPTERRTFRDVIAGSLLRGGRGVVDGAQAGAISSSASMLFDAVTGHERDGVRGEVATLGRSFASNEMDRLLRLSWAIWVATGGDPDGFPLPAKFGGVDDASLRFLLELDLDLDNAFWAAVGEGLTLERLIQLAPPRSPGLQKLCQANAGRLRAALVLVRPGSQTSPEPWHVESDFLCLSASGVRVYFASSHSHAVVPGASSEAPPVTTSELRRRLRGAVVESVTVSSVDGSRITVENSRVDPLDILDAEAEYRVRSAQVRVGGSAATCNFDALSAHGKSRAKYAIADLLADAVPLIWPQSNDSAQRQRALRDESVLDGGASQIQLPFAES